jgi:hypothetical protein
MTTEGVLMCLALLTGPVAQAADPPPPAQSPPPAAQPAAAQPAAAAPAAAPAAPAPGAAPAGPSGNPLASQGGPNATRLRDLERHVNELKEQIFRSKARLNLLKETVLHGVIAGARAVITHRNEMGSMYTPIRYVYSLDGTEIYVNTDETGKLADQKEITVFDGAVVPGNHTLSVQMVYQGNGYGLFTYLKGYKFTAKSSHTFTAGEGKQLSLKVVGFEKGNPVTTDPKDRPSVDFRETVLADKEVAAKAAAKK